MAATHPRALVAALALTLALVCSATTAASIGELVREVRPHYATVTPRFATAPLGLGVRREDVLPGEHGGRIVGGEDAKLGEFPHQVSMQVVVSAAVAATSPQHICGGSLVHTGWVLTAAHCVYGVPSQASGVEVVLGIDNLDVKAAGSQRIRVTRMLVHTKYDHYKDNGVGPYDIALLKLARPAKLSETVKLAALPVAEDQPSGDATLSGWGRANIKGIDVYPKQLQKAVFPVLSFKDCSAFVDKDPDDVGMIKESNLCVGPLDKAGLSTCSGDSGGPLVQTADDKSVTVIGIVSWGLEPCGQEPYPSVFTRVSAFIPWITAVIAKY